MVECSLFIDDFTNEKKVVVSKVGTKKTGWISFISVDGYLSIRMALIGAEDSMFINFSSFSPFLKMAKGDEIIILFDDQSILKFKFNIVGKVGSNNCRISFEELKSLATKTFAKLKITTKDEVRVFLLYGEDLKVKMVQNTLEYSSEDEGRQLLKGMSISFVQTIFNEMKIKADA